MAGVHTLPDISLEHTNGFGAILPEFFFTARASMVQERMNMSS
jgi:hypothetical protein